MENDKKNVHMRRRVKIMKIVFKGWPEENKSLNKW